LNLKVLLFCLLLAPLHQAPAQNEAGVHKHYFYHNLGYGSDALMNPLSLLINSGFGILQVEGRSRKLSEIDYAIGCKNVAWNVLSPIASIKVYGVGDFLANEVIPFSLGRKHGQFWPNYQNHLIGGGMSYRAMAEWYETHGFGYPRTLAAITVMATHFLNEVVENNSYVGRTVDPIADLYIFDPAGILLFSSESVSRFFAETLHLADWSYQPAYNPRSRTIENMGQNYSIKYKLRASGRLSIFYYFGMSGILGVSYEFRPSESFSLGMGLRAKGIVRLDEKTNALLETATLTWNAGFFYDRNNSLLFSILSSGVNNYRVIANVYPGLISFGKFSPGVFAALSPDNKIVAGLNVVYFPLGLAANLR